MYVVQILERGIENQLHGQSSCTVLLTSYFLLSFSRIATSSLHNLSILASLSALSLDSNANACLNSCISVDAVSRMISRISVFMLPIVERLLALDRPVDLAVDLAVDLPVIFPDDLPVDLPVDRADARPVHCLLLLSGCN